MTALALIVGVGIAAAPSSGSESSQAGSQIFTAGLYDDMFESREVVEVDVPAAQPEPIEVEPAPATPRPTPTKVAPAPAPSVAPAPAPTAPASLPPMPPRQVKYATLSGCGEFQGGIQVRIVITGVDDSPTRVRAYAGQANYQDVTVPAGQSELIVNFPDVPAGSEACGVSRW